VKLNPSKPARQKALGDIMKSDLWTSATTEAVTAGAPFKQTQQRALPRLGDLLRPDAAGLNVSKADARLASIARAEASVYQNVTPSGKKLKSLADILKPDVAGLKVSEADARLGNVARAEGSVFANVTPSGKKVKRLGDIIKTDIFKTTKTKGAPLKQTGTGSYNYLLPKYGDLFPDLFRARKPKGDRTLSPQNMGDLFDTLEGKKALKPERDYLTRSEQGRLGGDLSEEIEKQFKNLSGRKGKKSDSTKIAEDLFKIAKGKRKKTKDEGGLIEAVTGGSGGQSAVLIGGRSTGRQIVRDLEDSFGTGAPTPKGFKAPASAGFGGISIAKILSSTLPKGSARESSDIRRIIDVSGRLGTKGRSSADISLKDLIGGRTNFMRDLSTNLQSGQRGRQGFRSRELQGFKFDFGQGFKFRQATGQQFKQSQAFRSRELQGFKFDFGQAYKFKFDLTIPKPAPRRPINDLLRPAIGGYKRGGKKKKSGQSAQLRSFVASSLPLAFLGSSNKFARDFEKTFGDYY
jgi:hypothetical protein